MLNDQNQHFALRKLSVGLASVLIGLSFVGTANRVKADTVQSNASQNNVVQNDQEIKNNNDNSLQTVHSDPEQSRSLRTVQEHAVVQSSVQKQITRATQSVQSQAKDIQSASKQVTVPDSNACEVKFDSVAQRDYLKRLRNDKVSNVDSTVSLYNESKLLDTESYNQSFAYVPDTSVRQSHKYTINQHLPDGQVKTYTYNINLTGTQSRSTDVWTWTLDPDWEFIDSDVGILHINKKQGSLLNLGVAGYSIKLPFSNVSPHDQNWFALVHSANSMPMNVYSGDSKSYFAYFTYYNMGNATGLQNKIDHFIHLSDSQMYALWPKDSTVDLYYQPNPQSITYTFHDDTANKDISSKTLNGVTDQTINTNLTLPNSNYVLAQGSALPSTYKFGATNNNVVIHMVHKTQDVSATDPNTKMLNNYKVIENLPNSNPKTVWDVDIESHRSAVKNLVTGRVTYGDWETEKSVITNHTNNGNPGDPSFTPGINIDQVAGYTPVASSWQSSEKNNQGAWLINYWNDQNAFSFDFQPGVIGDTLTTYKSMPANRVFYINYTANPQSIKYVFADDDDNGKEVLTKIVNGVTDQTVNTNLTLPTNYVLAPNNTIPSTVKLGAVNNPVVIHVKHAVQDTTMTDPNASKKTVYRVIERMPNSHNKTVAEIDVISRKIATKDLVTGKTTYSDDYVYDKSSINAVIRNDTNTADPTEIFDAPIDQIPGYTIGMHESLSSLQDSKGNNMLRFFSRKDGTYILDFVVGNGQGATYKNPPESQDFYINYVPTKQQVTLNYYDSDDHDKLVKSETITGDYNSTIAITPTDTDNYYFDPDRSHSSEYHVGFTKANKPVAIYLKHKTNDTYDFDTSNRDIIVNLPNGVKHEYWQEIGFRRTKTVDLVTKKAVYGNWNVFDQTSNWRIDQTWQKSKSYIIKNGTVRFAPIALPNVPGYTPTFKWLNSRAMQINLVKD